MRFFEAAANWADRKAVDVKFSRDEYDGWFAILSFTDARGPFSATVNAIEPHNQSTTKRRVDGVVEKIVNPAETGEEFDRRVAKMMDKACVIARTNRIKQVTNRTVMRAAA